MWNYHIFSHLGHQFFNKAADYAIRTYLHLHDKPLADSNGLGNGEIGESIYLLSNNQYLLTILTTLARRWSKTAESYQ